MCLKLWFEDFVIGSGFEYPWAHAYNVAPLSVHIGSRQSMLAPAQGPHDTIALFTRWFRVLSNMYIMLMFKSYCTNRIISHYLSARSAYVHCTFENFNAEKGRKKKQPLTLYFYQTYS